MSIALRNFRLNVKCQHSTSPKQRSRYRRLRCCVTNFAYILVENGDDKMRSLQNQHPSTDCHKSCQLIIFARQTAVRNSMRDCPLGFQQNT